MSFSLAKTAYAAALSDFYAPGAAIGENVTLGQLISPIIQNIIILAGMLAFGVLIFAGFTYISASGDSQKVEQAQKMMTYAIIGLVLAVAAYWITRILISILGGTF